MSEALKNEIHAYFGKLTTTTTAKVSQWAYGQKLIVHDADLPSVFEAYYSNSRSRGEAKPQIGTDGEAPVPDEYFLSGADIYVFLMEHEGANDGRYRKIVHIPIDPCSQPSDVEPTPQEQSVIDQAIAALNTAVEQTGQDKEATGALAEAAAASSLVATEAAQSAQASATSASGSASTASTAAATATAKASKAATSATNAANAKTAAETAQGKAEAAQTASESAQASAQSAAQTATAKASEASTSATSASGSASAASASASAASGSATSAAASATSASGSATAAATSATTASTKASEASASATAASNAQTAAETAQGKAEDAQTAAETARDETVAEAATIRGVLKDKADIIISNAEGAIATFDDGGDDMPMVSCVASIEPVQSGSGDPSPQNVRPITGWTGCNVNVTGKNLFNQGKYTNVWTDYDYADGSYRCKKIQLSPNTTYTISQRATSTSTVPILLNNVSHVNESEYFDLRTAGMTKTYTTDESGCLYIGAYGTDVDVYTRIVECKVQIELGSTATAYEPYTGTTYPISWETEAGTVYGGTLDVVSGVLTVDRAMVDLGTLTWTLIGTSRFYAAFTPTAKVATTIAERTQGFICSCYPFSTNTGYADTMDDKSMLRGGNKMAQIMIKDTAYTDASLFKTAMNGVQLCYELAIPQTYQLTPVEVKTLLGLNNVWADTGDVGVQYRADTKLYIDEKNTDFSKLIAPTETDYTATRAYTSGSLLIVGNQLYKATTSIANGATLTVGTNITATTLAEVIAAL